MNNSFLHFIWIGPSFPLSLKKNLIAWGKKIKESQSEFNIILWLNQDSSEALLKYQAERAGLRSFEAVNFRSSGFLPCFHATTFLRFSPILIGSYTFHIGLVEDLIEQNKLALKDLSFFYKAFERNGCYAFCSDLLRLLVLAEMKGIYMDVDHAPHPTELFYKNINEVRDYAKLILAPFNKPCINFFMLPVEDVNHFIPENMIMMYVPNEKTFVKNNNLMYKIVKNILSGLELQKIHFYNSTCQYKEYLDNPKNQLINKSLLSESEYTGLLKAYKEKNYSLYKKVCEDLFQQEKYSNGKPLLKSGINKEKYLNFIEVFYNGTAEYYDRHYGLDFNNSVSYAHFLKANQPLFDKIYAKNSQTEFINEVERTPAIMYSWQNPGFSRLMQLDKAAQTLQHFYRLKKSREISRGIGQGSMLFQT